MGKSKSKSVTQPIYYPEQRQALQRILGMSMSHLGGAQTYQPQIQLPQLPQLLQLSPLSYYLSFWKQRGQKVTNPFEVYMNYLKSLQQQQPAKTQNKPDIFDILAQPYTGQLTAPLSNLEKQGLTLAQNYQPTQLTDETRNILLRTLRGEYLPEAVNSYYNPVKEAMKQQLDEALAGVRRSASIGGMLSSTPRLNLENKLRTEMASEMAKLLSNIYSRERAYQLQAIPTAMAVERQPLQTAETLMRLGAIPREVQQQALTAQYREWLRQMQALGIPLDIAMSLIRFSPGTVNIGKSSSWRLPFEVSTVIPIGE